MADTDLVSRALHDFLRAAYPWHVVIGAEDQVRSVGPLLERFCPTFHPGLSVSEFFQFTEPSASPPSFRSLLERNAASLDIPHSPASLRLGGSIVRLSDPSAIAFLGSPEVIRWPDLIELSRHYQGSLDRAKPSPTPATPASSSRRPRVLVVDDHPVNRLLATELLRQRQFDPVAIDGGQAAVTAAETGGVDFILMDVQMPEVSGIDATRAIREMEKKRGGHVPIIAVTAHAFAEDRDRCLAAGMDAYLSKPLRVDQLVATLEELGRTLCQSVIPTSPPIVAPEEAIRPCPSAEVAPAPPDRAPGDHARLIQGDPILVATVAEVFLQQTPLILSAMEAAIHGRNATDLAFHAHRLKGSLSYLEVPSLEAAARGLERQGKANRWDQVPIWWSELRSGIDLLKVELTELLGAHAAAEAPVHAAA